MKHYTKLFLLICWLMGITPCIAQQRKLTDVQHLADSVLTQRLRKGSKAKNNAVKTSNILAASEILKGQSDAFYVCDAGKDGFAIISGDERMTPVLGFVRHGQFDAADIPAAMRELLDSYAKEYEALCSGKPLRRERRRIEGIQEQVGPLITTQWGQTAPFNNRCPNVGGQQTITGCVAISSAQTLRYYQYPDSATGDVSYVTKTFLVPIEDSLAYYKFDWPNIRDIYKNGATQEECDAVANLVYACAIAAEMDFGIQESSTSGTKQTKALVENFGYDPDIAEIRKDYMTTNEWQTLMVNELNSERPVVYAAKSPRSGGHSFIVDGYKADEEGGYPFYHMNWGWEGYLDNYFKLSCLEVGNYDFIQEHEAIINIKPDNGTRDMESIWQAADIKLSTARINPTLTNRFTVTLQNVFNYSYKTFTGKFEVYLRNENDEETLVGSSMTYRNVTFGLGFANLTIQATLPANIEEGIYTLVLRNRADGSDVTGTVTYSSPLSITVTTVTESYTPNIMIDNLLNVGEDLEGLSVRLSAANPMNFVERIFTGTLSMAVADKEGNIIQRFGNTANINNLVYFGYMPYAYTFSGTLPAHLEDDEYRLYIVAQQSGYLEWGKALGYKIENGFLDSGHETYIPLWLEDGKIIWHKGSEEDLPADQSNIQMTDLEVKTFDPARRYLEMEAVNILNFGSEPFVGQLSMALYDEQDKFITAFGEPQKQGNPLGHFQSHTEPFHFSGSIPEDVKDGTFIIRIASKQNGCKGWSPIKGWVKNGMYITAYDQDLSYNFDLLNGKLYIVDTDGLTAPTGRTEQGPVYNLNGQKVNSQFKKGIYIVNGKKVVK